MKPRMVAVEWVDAHTVETGWTAPGAVTGIAPCTVTSVGWLVSTADQHHTIVTTINPHSSEPWHTPFRIPTPCVRTVTRLEAR